MRKTRVLILTVAIAVTLGTAQAWADELCSEPDRKAAAKAALAKAQALQAGGKLREAWDAAGQADSDCADVDTVKKQVAKAIGADEERKGRIDEAIDWYQRVNADADATRVITKASGDRPDDVRFIGRAIEYFRLKNDKGNEQKMRDIAKRNVEKQLAEEAKRFDTQLKESQTFLQKAQEWAYYAEWGKDRVRERAQMRGDFFAKEDSRMALKKAISYYFVGSLDEKIKSVKSKAAGLGKQAETKGEPEVAADYYMIADQGDKAEAITKQAEAAKQKVEEGRKKTFKKDQDDLEKALGF
ncbi:hypothetical protein [Candidatus Nitrospira nitrificans]|uniref:Uncharacterized protein n=1 Tax=Candidatus Nitrospira nitrificans TaxID=1742973 RepID=A0A0S4LI24_9BACT|nr:hypothetical protein [Candidatus Nitrospira nitrificans]CUS36558.1 exported hypothetical protein [Candidatus Nitrospira nitrificans]